MPSNFKGKQPKQSDVVEYKGASREIKQYKETEDRQILWTNALFSGMPTYAVSNIYSPFLQKLRFPIGPSIWMQLFWYVLCAFIMLISFGVRPWLAFLGAIGIGFATENLTIIAVGHNTKAAAIGYLPLVIAGCQYLFRKKYLLGLTILVVGLGLQILMNHIQIAYYGGFMVVFFFIFQFVKHITEKKLNEFFKVALIAIVGAGIALGANSLSIMLLQEYAKDSIRGESALTITKSDKVNEDAKNGLTKDYVFSYSMGWSDYAATIIPNYSGGDSDKLGLYYGQIGSTSGPKYIGITLFMLFLLGLVVIKGPIKWWVLTTIGITIILSMGGNNFVGFNTWMYENFPLYNKFRSPSMMIVLVQISVGLLGILAVEKLLTNPKDIDQKQLMIAGGSGILLIILLSFTGTMFNDFQSTPKYDDTGKMVYDSDTRYAQNIIQSRGGKPNPQAIESVKSQIVDRRLEEMSSDGSRSLLLALLVLVIIWLAYKQKLEPKYAVLILGILVTIDMWTVGKRYLDQKKFEKKRNIAQPFTPYSADLAIKQDKSYFRVLDLTGSPLNSNRCSYFHNSIGGYSAVKIRRYQDLWDWHLLDQLGQGQVQNNQILNMLNMKYFIYPNRQQQGAQPLYAPSPTALGNAWILNNVSVVDNADSAILALKTLQTATNGVVEKIHADLISTNTVIDSSASVKLLSYHPEKLEYEYNSSTESNVAFSEVYYDKGWNAYIDGEPVDHYRLNYILRGLKVPAGKHQIVFEFKPATYALGKTLSTSFGSIIYILIALSLFFWIKKEFVTPKEITS